MKPSRMTKYALWMTSFLAAASRWRALGMTERAQLCAGNARGSYQSLRYHLDRYTRQAVKEEGSNDFPNRDGNEAGFIDPGYTSHRGGKFIKAFLTSFLKKEGNEAGCSSWSRIRPSRNLIKAALFFNQAAARLTMYVKTALHAACATRWIQSGRFMGISPRTVSNLNAGRVL